MSGLWWRRKFPGEAVQVREVRRFVSGLLMDHPILDDAISCAVELSANAVRHTKSGQGGTFTVELWLSAHLVRIVVTDAGSSTAPSACERRDVDLPEGGRGLAMVAALSTRMGVEGDDQGHSVWAEFSCTSDQDSEAARARPIRTPTRLPPGWQAWFGQATRSWWAVSCESLPFLVEASSVEDLVRRIDLIEGNGSLLAG
jgi:anti-sigma regulatory factor (Ser/Thr protein kinase)